MRAPPGRPLRDRPVRLRRRRAAEPRAGRLARARAGAGAARAWATAAAARQFLEAEAAHPLEAFGGLREAAAVILGHVGRRSRITVHGDYDVDGITSTAILVRALRTLGRRRRLVPAEPDRRRLRPRRRHRRAARRARDAAAGHGRLRDHRGRRGRRRARRGAWTSWSPTTTRRAPTARCPTPRSCTRGSAATRARTCARPASPTSSPRR